MSEFFVGQKVVCVDDYIAPNVFYGDSDLPVLGATYTVVALMEDTGVRLKEIKRTHPEHGYLNRHFRPLESRAIEIFRAIAANPNIKICEDA